MMFQPQQIGVITEMARAMEDRQITALERQRIMDASLAFGISAIVAVMMGVLVRDFLREALEPEEKKAICPVIDVMLPKSRPQAHCKDIDTLDRLIKEKHQDINWEKWPHGTISDARKAVYKDILEGFGTLQEAKEYVEDMPGDSVIFTARGYEIPFCLIKIIIADIEKNPWLSPFRPEQQLERSWQPPLLPLVIKCAWCGKYLGEKEPYEDKSETHGICPECLAKYFLKKEGLLPQTHHSIPRDDLKRIADKYGWWAAKLAEAVCPHNDVACVEREARRLAEARRARLG
jgi:DNA-directed RNA polymerase subunit RPC12/RpoP